ncbi:MAG: serine hydrolase [Bacteroidia bacterium]|nr:serine hydrolase [Bacteroidia bacterium]
MIRILRQLLLLLLLPVMQSCGIVESILPWRDTNTAEEPALVAPTQPPVHVALVEYDSLLADFDIAGYPRLHSAWVDSVYETLSPRGRLGQLITEFSFSEANGRTLTKLLASVRRDSIGGVIFSRGSSASLRKIIDTLSVVARVPLLFSADFEYGPGMRLTDGYRLPSMMAIAATRSPDLAYRAGTAVAKESRALGIGQNYAPVCDINSNPQNPIINTRSFGEDRELVAEMAEAYMRGMQDAGLIATAKHFPGHGDTQTDSHTKLPLLRIDRQRLDSLELYPFRRLVDAGVMSVMPGHLAVPSLSGDSSLPATLSRVILDSLLRDELGFRGLVVSDAMNMKALTRSRVRNIPATALAAGIDVLLMPEDASTAVDSLEAAMRRGELDSAAVARSVKRVLAMKEWSIDQKALHDSSEHRLDQTQRHRQLARHIAARAVTLLGNQDGLLPLTLEGKRIGVLSLSRDERTPAVAEFAEALRATGAVVRHVSVDATSRNHGSAVRDSLARSDVLFIAGFLPVINGTGSIGLTTVQRAALEQAAELRKPAVALAFGSPYFCAAYPQAKAWVCSYSDDEASVLATVDMLKGDIPASGRLPVSIPGIAHFGAGVQTADGDERVSIQLAAQFRGVDSLIHEKIRDRAFPGAQLLVRLPNGSIYRANYGRHSYDSDAWDVSDSTLYDIASLTKVVATTSAVMRLFEDGRLHLDSSAASYLPEFGENGKDVVTIRQLLQHRGGLEAFRQFHPSMSTESEVLHAIYASQLQAPAGSRTLYSDFGMIVLGKIVERVTGMRLDEFLSDILLKPLGMRNTMFTPPDSLRHRIAPTEVDTSWRRRLIHGEVHDETASLLSGVAGHAGLFANADDLGRFAEMLLHLGGGIDSQLFKPSTVLQFTSRERPRDTRALGWDMRSVTGSSAGHYFSLRSYGHTGFTGTSIWIDPSADIYVIFLTNRVHPTRANQALPRFRATLHDAIREAISALPL